MTVTLAQRVFEHRVPQPEGGSALVVCCSLFVGGRAEQGRGEDKKIAPAGFTGILVSA